MKVKGMFRPIVEAKSCVFISTSPLPKRAYVPAVVPAADNLSS